MIRHIPCTLPRTLAGGSLVNPSFWNSKKMIRRIACAAARPLQPHLLVSMLSGYLDPYWHSTPSAEEAVSAIAELLPHAEVGFDHFAFRTFGVPQLGIASMAQVFTDLGYEERAAEEPLEFPAKHLRARWFSPPQPDLPRIFISELKVEELSQRAQHIIERYTSEGAQVLARYGPVTGLLGVSPWAPPHLGDYEALDEETEYGAWVLVNGYSLNHATVAVHRLERLGELAEPGKGVAMLNSHLQAHDFEMNAEGGEVKVSPDGLLLQSSTVADKRLFEFAGGETQLVASGYLELAERLVLPQFRHLRPEETQEHHRRDGFEAANADRIFESTTVAVRQLKQEQHSGKDNNEGASNDT